VIVVVMGSIIMGFIVIALVSAFSSPPPKAGAEDVGGVEIAADVFYDKVEQLLHRQGLIIESVDRSEDDGIVFQVVDPTPVRGARLLVLARPDPPGTPISLEDVNAFSDSLRGQEAHKGVFITTAGFLPDAESGETRFRLELIDGERFMEILGEHGIA
jgi:restriction system protein